MSNDICPCCQQKIRKSNPHHMDLGKTKLLMDIARIHRTGVMWVKVQRDGNLIKPQHAHKTIQCDDVHALRLMWFGLLETRERRSGEYRLTEQGRYFLKGTFPVPERILCKDGKVVEESKDRVFIDQVKHVILDKEYWNNYAALPWVDFKLEAS